LKLCSECKKMKPDGECDELHDKWGKMLGVYQCHDCTDRFRDWMSGIQIDSEKADSERFPT
jgi:hypothetical protein